MEVDNCPFGRLLSFTHSGFATSMLVSRSVEILPTAPAVAPRSSCRKPPRGTRSSRSTGVVFSAPNTSSNLLRLVTVRHQDPRAPTPSPQVVGPPGTHPWPIFATQRAARSPRETWLYREACQFEPLEFGASGTSPSASGGSGVSRSTHPTCDSLWPTSHLCGARRLAL